MSALLKTEHGAEPRLQGPSSVLQGPLSQSTWIPALEWIIGNDGGPAQFLRNYITEDKSPGGVASVFLLRLGLALNILTNVLLGLGLP